MSPQMKLENLSKTQQKVLKWISGEQNRGEVQIAGKGRAPYLSAARALLRRGLAWTFRTGSYGATDAGRELVEEYETRIQSK